MRAYEVNFDGLVGPTHNYSGLSFGNVASMENKSQISNPKEAAKQGLVKMKLLHDLGVKQGVFPPQERPDIHTLRLLGFTGSNADVISKAAKDAPLLFSACCSASAMWTANAATVSPSADTSDGRVHFTPANLVSKFHRAIETETTSRILKAIFSDATYFRHHPPLPACEILGDEGAANHTRFCEYYGHTGLEFFVFGRNGTHPEKPAPKRFPARQTFEASSAIARMHGLSEDGIVFAQQNPKVIDAGVFHNDVIAVGNQNLLIYHEKAFLNQKVILAGIKKKFEAKPLHLIGVKEAQVSVQEAVRTYLFNSQIVTMEDGSMVIIVPRECELSTTTWKFLQELTQAGTPLKQVKSIDLKQSMQNGGGPACLRLRVVLTEQELAAANPGVLFDEVLFSTLNKWVEKHYRDHLSPDDLRDPQLLIESRTALDELTQILDHDPVYLFQLN